MHRIIHNFNFYKITAFQLILLPTILVISKVVLNFEVTVLNKNPFLTIHLNKSVHKPTVQMKCDHSDHSFQRKKSKTDRNSRLQSIFETEFTLKGALVLIVYK